jgi:hypothetical protein
VAQNHRGAGAAEERCGTEEARHRQHPDNERPAGGDVDRLQHQRDRPAGAGSRHQRRANRGERPPDGRPVHDHGGFGDGQRGERRSSEQTDVVEAPEGKRHGNQDGREARVEPEELHSRLARHERESEDDSDREMREEKEENQLSAAFC